MMHKKQLTGFTLIEVLVTLAIVATLMSIAAPRYFSGVERSKEATLRHDLFIMRDALDKFYSDNGVYPDKLEELVQKKYLRAIPQDPITESTVTWITVPPPSLEFKGLIYDIKSGAEGFALNNTSYKQW